VQAILKIDRVITADRRAVRTERTIAAFVAHLAVKDFFEAVARIAIPVDVVQFEMGFPDIECDAIEGLCTVSAWRIVVATLVVAKICSTASALRD
jgi:hypothetical protein